MAKLYSSKTFLKMAGGRMHSKHTPPPIPGSAPDYKLHYRNHQKNLTYFSHLAPLILFFCTKWQSQKGEGRPWRNAPPKYAPV